MHKPAQKNREDCLKVYLVCLQCVIKLYIFLIHIICRINGNVKLKVNCSLVHADNIFSGFHSSIISKLRTSTHWNHSFWHLQLCLSSSIYSYRLSVTLEFRKLRVRFSLKSHKILKNMCNMHGALKKPNSALSLIQFLCLLQTFSIPGKFGQTMIW